MTRTRGRTLVRSFPAPTAMTTSTMPPAHPAPASPVPRRLPRRRPVRRPMRRTMDRIRQWTGSLRIGAGGRSAPVRSGMIHERLVRQGCGGILRPQACTCTGKDHASKQRAQRAAAIHFIHGIVLREIPCPLLRAQSLRHHSAGPIQLMSAPLQNATRNNELMPTTIVESIYNHREIMQSCHTAR